MKFRDGDEWHSYTGSDLLEIYNDDNNNQISCGTSIKNKCKDISSVKNFCAIILSFIPILSWLPKYKVKTDLLRDVSAGITLGIIQIPQGMAYGMLTTLPPIYGLYTSLIPSLIYMFFGTSRHLNIGTFAIVCLMVGETIQGSISASTSIPLSTNATIPHSPDMVEIKAKYAVACSLLVGFMQVALGVLHFSFVTVLLSDPLITGFTTGAAFHIFSSQVKHFVGMDIPRERSSGVFGIFKLYGYIFSNITDVNIASLVIGIIASILLYTIKYFTQKYKSKIKFPIPAELIVVVLGTGLSYGLKFNERYSVKILKKVPTGLPPLSIPEFGLMKGLVTDCITIAIVSFAINISIAKAFAKKNKYKIDPNQELYGYGISNIVASFFSCFVSSGSLSRSLVQEQLGSTQIAVFFSGILVVLVLTVMAPLFACLPNAILAAIVLVTLKSLFMQFKILKNLYKVSIKDMIVWMMSFGAVLCLGVDYGLGVAIIVNLLVIIVTTARPSFGLLNNLKKSDVYIKSSSTNTQLVEHHGIKIFQFSAPLVYVNVERFQEKLYQSTVPPDNCARIAIPKEYRRSIETGSNDSDDVKIRSNTYSPCSNGKLDHEPTIPRSGSVDSPPEDLFTQTLYVRPPDMLHCPLHTIILDFSQISFVDTMGISTLMMICREYEQVGVDVFICNFTGDVLNRLNAGGLLEVHNIDNFFPSITDAVAAAQSKEHLKGICKVDMKHHNMDLSFEVIKLKQSDGDDEELMLDDYLDDGRL